MFISELLKGVKYKKKNFEQDIQIEGVSSDSRKIKKNYLFIAVKGTKRDGNNYISEAVNNGAIIIISENESNSRINQIIVENVNNALSLVWSNYYHNPSSRIKTVGVTGTNGKTSCSFFLYNILRTAGKSCGLISTVECRINNKVYNTSGGSSVSDLFSAMTTPDPEILYRLLAIMRDEGCEYAVIEISSHSLKQCKIDGMGVDIGVFTNLSPEHLDFHINMEDYFESKLKLFEMAKEAVVNIDDPFGKRIANIYEKKSITCSCNEPSDYIAKNIISGESGCEYLLFSNESTLRINSVICGDYTVYNSMLAASCADYLGIDSVSICEGIRFTNIIKGRLEKFKNTNIYIDYAHTPYAMENVIKSVKKFSNNKKVIVLFGCGGDRDRSKREEMGKIASKLADFTVITSDNPRTENPVSIISEILKGFMDNTNFIVIPDRRNAIVYAVEHMKKDEYLLLLGKGHENYEISLSGKHQFDERKIIDEVLIKND